MENDDNGQITKKINFGKRTYFFDIKKASNGSNYLKITESRFVKDGEPRKRNVFVLFKDDLKDFSNTLKEAIKEF